MSVKRILGASALLLYAGLNPSYAQYHNLYPCGECAVYDNNGSDLYGFIKSAKKDLNYIGSKVNEFSDNKWGFLAVKTVKVPSIDQQQNLNYSEYINTTLALYKTKDGSEATWWGRQANTPQGSLFSRQVELSSPPAMDIMRYRDVAHELQQKEFAIVEYYSDSYNPLDYDVLLKNYILVEHGAISDINDYKTMISFYDHFLTKFTYLDDPLLENKSFITFFSSGGNKYMVYFNIVNGKLAGHLEKPHIEYEKDKDNLASTTFKKLTGNVVYMYGNDIFGLEKTFLKYSQQHNLELKRAGTDMERKFNDDK